MLKSDVENNKGVIRQAGQCSCVHLHSLRHRLRKENWGCSQAGFTRL